MRAYIVCEGVIGIGWLNCFLILPLITLWGNLSQFCQHTLFWRHSRQFQESQFCKKQYGEVDKCWIISNLFQVLVFIAELQQSSSLPASPLHLYLCSGQMLSALTLQDCASGYSGDKKLWLWVREDKMQSPALPHITWSRANIQRKEQFWLWHRNQHYINREEDRIICYLNDKSLTDQSLSVKILKISVQFARGHSNLRSTKRSLS